MRMKMKSNQRREAEQLVGSQFLRFPLRKLVRIQEEDGNGSLAGMSDNLLIQASKPNNEQQQQQVLMRSKTMNRLGSANSEYCAINSNKETKSSSSSLNLHYTNIINNKNLDYSNKSTMYNIITSRSVVKKTTDKQQRASVNRLARCQARLQATSAARIFLNGSLSSRIHRQTLTFVVISLALTSCILINQIQAYSTPSDTAAESPQAPASQSSPSSQSSSSSSSDSSPAHSLASSVASSALSSLSSAIISAAFQDGKSSSNSLPLSANSGGPEVAPSPTLSAGSSSSSLLSSALSSSSSSSSSSSAPTSIAASLSSAVASAAAAAAVAAAQNSLSGNDARSLLTSSSNKQQTRNHNHLNHHHQNSRNTGLNLAIKLADAIPEVPYNILHNMKKLDHAAPFYNVGNKESYSGNSKESSHGLLASALHASGSFGGAAEQLSHLFRSPIWKRIADGYGEFTSEFRSLFRAPSTTMKGPTNPTTKLLRDISVPALLMILASTIPGDWRPVRTRRKSLIPSDLVPAYPLVDPMMASASSELPTSYSPTPRLYGSMPNFNLALQQQQQQMNPLAQMYNQLDQSASAAAASSSSSQARTNDINLQQQQQQPADAAGFGSASTVAWLQPQTVAQHSELTSPNQMHNNYDTQLHQIQLQQHPQQIHHQQQQPSIKRFGDSLLSALSLNPSNDDSTKSQVIHSDLKPVNGDRLYSNNNNNLASASNPLSQTSTGGLFSSLTSSLANQVGQSKLMSRIRNANVASTGSSGGIANFMLQPSASNSQQQRAASSSSMNNEQHKMSSSYPVSRDNLDDRHRYSLVDNNNDNSMLYFGKYMNEKQQQKSASPSTKPFLLSAMTQALGSMLANSSPLESSSSDAIISRKMFTLNGNNNPFLVSDKVAFNNNHHQHDSILRRNHQAAPGMAMEQRELSKLIPQSWREVVKRTVNSVQEQATTQWRSIEGQLANWVQDKLKTLPGGAAAASGGSASSPPAVAAPAPVANILASVGSTALNMLGLGGRSQTSNATTAAPTNVESSANDEASQATSTVLKNKNDSTSKPKQPIAKGALAGVANMIVNTLANRQSPSASSSSLATSTTTAFKPKSSISSDETSSSGNLVSQYPTLTGIQVAQSPSSSSVDLGSSASSVASGTASTIPLMAA